MASGVRAFSVRLIFSMICMTWSCSTLMHACEEPLSSVTLKCIVNLLKHTKYAFMLYVLSKCICYTMLWLSCFCDENSKQLSSNRSLLITSHTVLECLFNHCTHCGSNKCQKQANKQKNLRIKIKSELCFFRAAMSCQGKVLVAERLQEWLWENRARGCPHVIQPF